MMVINGIPNCRLVIMKYGVILPGYWGVWTNPYERAAYQPAIIMRWDTGIFNSSNGWFICIETWLVKIPNVLFGDVTGLLSKWSTPPKKNSSGPNWWVHRGLEIRFSFLDFGVAIFRQTQCGGQWPLIKYVERAHIGQSSNMLGVSQTYPPNRWFKSNSGPFRLIEVIWQRSVTAGFNSESVQKVWNVGGQPFLKMGGPKTIIHVDWVYQPFTNHFLGSLGHSEFVKKPIVTVILLLIYLSAILSARKSNAIWPIHD